MTNYEWSNTARFLQKIEESRKFKSLMEMSILIKQPVNSGVFAFFERRNFEKHIENLTPCPKTHLC